MFFCSLLLVAIVSPGIHAFYNFSDATLNAKNLTALQLVEILFKNYSYKVRPNVDKGIPTVVHFNLFINSLSSVNEMSMDVTLDVFLRQQWIDPRFAFPERYKTLTLNPWDVNKIWIPDVYFPFEREAKTHTVTLPNLLVRLYPNGKVFYSQRLTIQNVCYMDMKYFPLDAQHCRMDLESYAFTTNDLIFEWANKPYVQVRPSVRLPEFQLKRDAVKTGNCTATYNTGTFPCIYMTFVMKREIGYYLIQTFVPSVLIVVLSWVSFWIDIQAVPARISLGLLTVLTMTTQSSGILSRMPRVSYIKAIDVWMTLCMVFVFSALVEFSVVNVLARQDAKRREEAQKRAKNHEINSLRSIVEQERTAQPLETFVHARNLPKAMNKQTNGMSEDATNQGPSLEAPPAIKITNNALMADKVSRVCFPLVFVVFNLCYWLGYILTEGHR